MEPILPEPITQEGNQNTQEPQVFAGLTPVSAEISPNSSPERTFETPAVPASGPQQVAAPIQQAQPFAHPTDPVPSAVVADPVANPIIADDVDVIEKEWVDKAKRIVNSTNSDPHLQEKEVSKLQADYLQKRYNKTIKLAE